MTEDTNISEAGRSGPKSSAQTPSKPEEKRKGSKTNPPGSAGTKPDAKEKAKKILERKDDKKLVEDSQAKITFSERVGRKFAQKYRYIHVKNLGINFQA